MLQHALRHPPGADPRTRTKGPRQVLPAPGPALTLSAASQEVPHTFRPTWAMFFTPPAPSQPESAACQHRSFLLCPVSTGCMCYQPEDQPLLQPWAWVFGRGADLKGLDEGPQEGPDTFTPAQQLHQTHHPEQPEKSDGDPGIVIRVLQAEHNNWSTQSAETSRLSRQGVQVLDNEIPPPGSSHGSLACTQDWTAKVCWHFPPAFPGISSPQAPMLTLLTLG